MNRMDIVYSKLSDFLDKHRYFRADTELVLETTPREAQYSSKVAELMRREEMCLRDGVDAADVFKSVDELITAETRSIFSRITNQKCKKWEAFLKSM
jgi:hypothetical protein